MPTMLVKAKLPARLMGAMSLCLIVRCAWGQIAPPPTETIALTSAPPYSATGELFLLKADTNSVGLRNPVLVVEGFDIDNSMGWEALYNLLNQEHLAEDIQAYGRDLLVLNFGDSTIDVVANAALTKSAISYINAHRDNPDDKFTAVGASLGGLTTRQALVEMPAPDVDTWISFDVPHEGANIPLGLQEYVEFFAPHDDDADTLLSILDSPAPRQMLLVHHSHPDGLAGGSLPERADYQSMLDGMGYPTNCKAIAISNGSGSGEKYPFASGEHIIHWAYTGGIFDPDTAADVYALPQTSATVFSGSINLIIPIDSTTVTAYNPLSLDNAPGGGRATFIQLYTNIPPDQIDSNDYCTQTNHCFIPTVSALGIPIAYIESNLVAHPDLLTLSPFDEIHFGTNNEGHVEINAHNKRWFIRALLEDVDTDGDGLDDYEESLIGTAYDSAQSTLQVVQSIAPSTPAGSVQIKWNALPNTQYEIWAAETLEAPWQLIETVPPSTNSTITRDYAVGSKAPSAFFQIAAYPVDPVGD